MGAAQHTFEKVGHHRERKRRRAARATARNGHLLGRTKGELLTLARRLAVRGRSRMSKPELARALERVR